MLSSLTSYSTLSTLTKTVRSSIEHQLCSWSVFTTATRGLHESRVLAFYHLIRLAVGSVRAYVPSLRLHLDCTGEITKAEFEELIASGAMANIELEDLRSTLETQQKGNA